MVDVRNNTYVYTKTIHAMLSYHTKVDYFCVIAQSGLFHFYSTTVVWWWLQCFIYSLITCWVFLSKTKASHFNMKLGNVNCCALKPSCARKFAKKRRLGLRNDYVYTSVNYTSIITCLSLLRKHRHWYKTLTLVKKSDTGSKRRQKYQKTLTQLHNADSGTKNDTGS